MSFTLSIAFQWTFYWPRHLPSVAREFTRQAKRHAPFAEPASNLICSKPFKCRYTHSDSQDFCSRMVSLQKKTLMAFRQKKSTKNFSTGDFDEIERMAQDSNCGFIFASQLDNLLNTDVCNCLPLFVMTLSLHYNANVLLFNAGRDRRHL